MNRCHLLRNKPIPTRQRSGRVETTDRHRSCSVVAYHICQCGRYRGCDASLGYYRFKLDCEEALQDSGVAHTISRATHFNDFVDLILRSFGIGRVLLKPQMSLQPLDVEFAA